MKNVLIFDSGVGGLSVYQEIANVLPEQPVIYAFDNAAFPYGELDDAVLIDRVCAMITALCSQHDVALVVIACNTASTLVLPHLRAKLSIPVVGVVPAIKPASALSKRKVIGLLATPATVKRSYTQQLVNEFAKDCEVLMLGSTELVQMGEDKLRGDQIDTQYLSSILSPLVGNVDCLVLGCTHFPLLKAEIEAVFGDACDVIDSGRAIANRVELLLKEGGNLASRENKKHKVYSSAPVNREEALNSELAKLGFDVISRAPTFSDRSLL